MKGFLRTAALVFVGLVVAMAPFLVASRLWWSGIASIAIFAVLVAMVGTASDGVRIGLKFSLAFVGIGTIAVAVAGSPVLASLVVAGVAAAIAICAIYQVSGPMLMAALFAPYLIHSPPDALPGNTNTWAFYAAVAGTLLAAGLWGTLLAWLVRRGKPTAPKGPAISVREGVLTGVIVAVVGGLLTLLCMTQFPKTEWVWLLLTLFVLTKPAPGLNLRMTRDRVAGTMVGVAVALLIGLLGLPTAATTTIGVLALTTALTFRLHGKPYWLYASFLTPAVIMFDSVGADPTSVAEQRLIYTVTGAVLAVALSAGINQFVMTASSGAETMDV